MSANIETIVYHNPHPTPRAPSDSDLRMRACLEAIREDRCGHALKTRSTRRPLTRKERRRKHVCHRCRSYKLAAQPGHGAESGEA